ncbi:MAG: hypothetical protein ACOC1P_00665 [Minisyncoccales bacterium]
MKFVNLSIIFLVFSILFLTACEEKITGNIVYSPKDNNLESVPLKSNDGGLSDAIIDQCLDLCGDGYCNEYRCLDEGNPEECNSVTNSCPEDEIVCPQDC